MKQVKTAGRITYGISTDKTIGVKDNNLITMLSASLILLKMAWFINMETKEVVEVVGKK